MANDVNGKCKACKETKNAMGNVLRRSRQYDIDGDGES